jgi:glycosyltransferase involved in cell wall biosynthesis
MASGKPIVATHIDGTPELVMHEQTGLLVPPGDPSRIAEAVNRLLGNKNLCTEFGKAGKQRVHELFGIERMISETEALYQKFVDERKLS